MAGQATSVLLNPLASLLAGALLPPHGSPFRLPQRCFLCGCWGQLCLSLGSPRQLGPQLAGHRHPDSWWKPPQGSTRASGRSTGLRPHPLGEEEKAGEKRRGWKLAT